MRYFYRKAKYNFKRRRKVDTVLLRDMQQPSCVIFDTINVNLSTRASECSLISIHRCCVVERGEGQGEALTRGPPP